MPALVEYGLMPDDATERKQLEGNDPYALRARALDAALEPNELGRVLFHLNQRRGFKSNRKAAGDEKEDGQIRAKIGELRRRMEESQARTLGEFLYRRRRKGSAVRARPEQGLYPDRAMYEEEFDYIRAAQESRHSLNREQWDRLRRIIFHQRPLRPVDPGWCQLEFENGERRAAKALPVFQEFRMLQEVNNLRIQVGLEPERALAESERARAMQRLRDGKSINLEKPTRDLGLPSGAKFNLAAGGRKSIQGDATTAKLASSGKKATAKKPAEPALFGKQWFDFSLDRRNEIVKFLLDTDDPAKVVAKAVAEWELNYEPANAVANVSLAPGYGNLSEKAIRKLLPHLEAGKVFSDAVQAAGYEHHSDFRNAEAHDELPYYGQALPRDAVGADPTKDPERDGEPAVYGRIANPTVHIGLNQLRRVVNQLTKAYGKPEEIVVELARELKMNREQKRNYERQQDEGANRNKRFAEMLASAEQGVTADALRKLRLWEEQKSGAVKICPYTGRTLSFEMVMSAQTEIDHILPFSRTLDNSMGNLVVCMVEANREKRNRTPYEAFGERCLEYVKDLPANQRWRFQQDAMERFEKDERGFLDRQLNETQYLSRTARTYLAWLYDEKGEGRQRVRVIPGRMTALLRRGWGLEGMLNGTADGAAPRKTRDDHRHHAIDAFVVANTTPGLLQRFAQAAGSDYRDAAERLAKLAPDPWPGFDRSQVRALLDKMAVSYKPDHGTRDAKGQTTGQLHQGTAYGLIEPVGDGRHKVVLRKDLSKFTQKDLDNVRDAPLRDALRGLWDAVGGKPAEFAARAANEGVPVNGRRQRVRRVRMTSEQRVIPIRHTDSQGRVHQKGYLPGGNEFADVWQMPDGSWQTVVTATFYANQPDFNVDDYRPHPAAKRLMRLHSNDMGALGEGDERRIVRVRQMDNSKDGPRVVLDDHKEADVDRRIRQDAKVRKKTKTDGGMKLEVYSAAKLRRLGFRKVRVDELGRVYDRGPFQP